MSITKPNEISIAVTRLGARTSDGAGGYTGSAAAITGSPFSGRFIRKPTLRPEGIAAGTQGQVANDQIVLVFPAGSDIRTGDICTVDSVAYTVQIARSYRRSVQADVEAVM